MEYNKNYCNALLCINNKLQQCSSKKGLDNDYCGKHKFNKTNKRIRIDDYDIILKKYSDIINPREVLFKEYLSNPQLKDISIYDIFYTLQKYNKHTHKHKHKHSDEIKQRLIDLFDSFLEAQKYEHIYRMIQSKFRLRKLLLHGPCYYKKEMVNNETDFFTLDNILEIPNNFFFSFLDKNGFYYAFDIRSLNKLLKNNNKNNQYINPYSTSPLIDNVIIRIKRLIKYLKPMTLEMEDDLTPEQKRKDAIIRIFSLIDNFGYQTNVEWLSTMTIKELKKLYRMMEDIWNYRCDLTIEAKMDIIPLENVIPLFYLSVDYVSGLSNYNKILDIILRVFERLVSDSQQLSSCSLGALYVLTGIASVSIEAGLVYPDLIQSDDYY
jgi:hypothetical protein